MTVQWEPVLKDVISEVLETMFFAFVDLKTEIRALNPSIMNPVFASLIILVEWKSL